MSIMRLFAPFHLSQFIGVQATEGLCFPMQVPDDDSRAEREAVLQLYGIDLEHNLRLGPMSPRILACLRVLSADAPAMRQMLAGSDETPFKVALHACICSCLHH